MQPSKTLTHHTQYNLDDFLSDLSRVSQLNPNLTEAYYYRAVRYTGNRIYLEHRKDLTQAIRLNSNFAEAY
ncbi:hypothetical protein H6F76_09065 [Leptolyngbya sp. FACHB-321]|nr:hypothetical protein [Leptolyngbya sp. FACHB-321]